jgi:hypothetical protein
MGHNWRLFQMVRASCHREFYTHAYPITEVLTHILSHLPAASLSAVSLVSRRFYSLVTTPHAWRIAFSRYFPGPDATTELELPRLKRRDSEEDEREALKSEQRFFARLTGVASWRSEYILRTRLLRSLARGKPSRIAPGHGASSRTNSAANNANPVVTYNSQLFSTINHMHAVFNNGKKPPRFIHGTAETGTACTSDPQVGKVDNWGLSDPQALPQFADLYPGDTPFGLGRGLLVGAPNVMDVSQPYGMVYGEGFPGGQVYFRSSEEMRGRFISSTGLPSEPQFGIPKIIGTSESHCAVWIAKSNAIPLMTDNLIGMLSGSSSGILTAYSVGADNLRDNRLGKGEITAKWVLSPGVPIIAISVDDSYNDKRKGSGRVWAVALNALGEIFYLTNVPQRPAIDRSVRLDAVILERLAWETGRSVYWQPIEPSRRIARENVFREAEFDGSYSPRSSSRDMNLSKQQLVSETHEIEKFLKLQPVDFLRVCEGWDMRRKLEVDFAGSDGHGAGEGIVVLGCGIEEDSMAEVKRYTRWKSEQNSLKDFPQPRTPPPAPEAPSMASLFGSGGTVASEAFSIFGGVSTPEASQAPSPAPQSVLSTPSSLKRLSPTNLTEEWRVSLFVLPDSRHVEITAAAMDMSIFALATAAEDPLLTINSRSTFSSPAGTPLSNLEGSPSPEIPGYRARFLAVGTKTGSVFLWNMRAPQSSNAAVVNELRPLRTIHTDSPQISCLAMSALYLVHGGNDGLVQAWDPLASTMQPVRTLHSRFSSRARRRLVQAEASAQGVGINLYAAGAIAIDPDPTVLRGMVSLGAHLRYWSYSSSAADQYASKKRRLRRSSERGHNGATDRFTTTGRGALMDYIATEQEELKKETERREKEEARLAGRFGVGLGGLTDEEALKYAEMVSQEAYQQDQERRIIDTSSASDVGSSHAQSAWTGSTVTPASSVTGTGTSATPRLKTDDELDQEIEEAIRLSLMGSGEDFGSSPDASATGGYDIPILYKGKKSRLRRSPNGSPSSSQLVGTGEGNVEADVDDLEFALQLSLAEEKSRQESAAVHDEADEYPSLGGLKGKGKGRA